MLELLTEHRPITVFNLAAESHVDRSIDDGTNFIDTNIAAVYRLLNATLAYWQELRSDEKEAFRFIQTDETFGSILEGEFTEESPYSPNSPYAASKAAGDHPGQGVSCDQSDRPCVEYLWAAASSGKAGPARDLCA